MFGRVSDYDLKLLRVFVVLVEQGSFTAAQGQLNIGQSVLSESLKALETRLGMRLCERGPGGFKVLDEGQKVYDAAVRLFDAAENFRLELTDIASGYSGELTIAIEDAIVCNPASRIALALSRFQRISGPNVGMRIETMSGYQVVTAIANGTSQIGITAATERAELRGISVYKLFDEPLSLYGPAPSNETFEGDPRRTETRDMPGNYSTRGHLEPRAFGILSEGYRQMNVGLGAQSQLLLVLSGQNVSLLPDHYAAPYVGQGRLVKIDGETSRTSATVCAVVQRKNEKIGMVKAMIDILVELHDGEETSQLNAVREEVGDA